MIKRILGISIIILFILICSGCSIFKPEVKYVDVVVEVEKKCVSQYPDDISLRDIDWVVVDNYWVALSPEDYEDLSINTAEMLRYIKQTKVIIKKCEEE